MSNFKGPIYLLVCSIIWGSTFVAQSVGMDSIGPFSFNVARFIVGFFALMPITLLSIKKAQSRPDYEKYIKTSILNGLTIGIFTGVASSFQQYGLLKASASKAGFLTALYIVLVPIIGIFFKRSKLKGNAVFAVGLAMIGFYLLSVKGDFTIESSDIYLIISAFLYSFQIILIDIYDDYADPIILSEMQLVPSIIMSIILAIIFKEQTTIINIKNAMIPILYAGVLSLGVAYTFQIIGQKYTEPTLATLIMSLESVFAAITGYLFQHDVLTTREFVGCIIIFASVIICQINFKKLKKQK